MLLIIVINNKLFTGNFIRLSTFRDLKPENILFDSKRKNAILKVVDFGTSRKFDPNNKLHTKVGDVLNNILLQ